MPRQKITDEIETLRHQKVQLDARLKAAEARHKEHEAEQKNRRKLLLGGIILDFMLANPDTPTTQAIRDLLLKHAKRPADKTLFADLLSDNLKTPQE